MVKSREAAIEAAKKIVSSRFNIVSRTRSMSGKSFASLYEESTPAEVKGVIVELSGKYAGMDKESKSITLKTDEGNAMLIPVKETVYSRSIEKSMVPKDGELYVIAIHAGDYPVYIPVAIVRESEKHIFSAVKSLYSRANAIRDFCKLEEGQQKNIAARLENPTKYKRFEAIEDSKFESRIDQVLLYALTKELYPPETQRAIEIMHRDREVHKHKVESRLRYIFGISPVCDEDAKVRTEDFERALSEKFYKMDRPKKQIKDLFMSLYRAEKKGCNLLLVGSPGVGKTSLMKAVAEAMNLPFDVIPMNGLSCPLEIEGLDPDYDSADAGSIVKAFAAHGTSKMVLGLDEFDKINKNSKEGNPYNVFLRTFLGEHYDKFLGCTIRTDNTIFIATANSVDNIPEAVMNRFDAVIYLEDYSYEDKLEIAKRFVIPGVLKSYRMDDKKISFAPEAIFTIIKRYCEDEGARDLEHGIKKVVCRLISENLADKEFTVTPEYVEEVLGDLVEETPALYFSRNREFYSPFVAKEIKKCIQAEKCDDGLAGDRFGAEKSVQKLAYLLPLRNEEKTFLDDFDPKHLEKELHKNLFGMDEVIKEVTNIYYTSYLKGDCLNSNLALCGGSGIGKTTIAKSLAAAMGYNYMMISLNGISDIKELRGFSSTYIGSEPGRIIKGFFEAGSLRTIVQLDEIDKSNPEISSVLLDLLDREYTDNFLGVPVDLSQCIFIATANDFSKVSPVIRDRFMVVNVEGYTRGEKKRIVRDYIIPKLEKGYATSGVSIKIDEEAESFLLKNYATSFGVRDAEKAMQRITSSKLVEMAGKKHAKTVNINKEDVRKYLGEIPIPGGNFPCGECLYGVSKALAVTDGNKGSCFAIETVLIDGEDGLEMTGLPKETVTDSVKIAVIFIKKNYPELLKDKYIHVHFGEGSVPKDGPSAGVALLMSILSAALEKPIMDKTPYDIAYTGEISLSGGVFAIGGTFEKIQAAMDSGCSRVFIPKDNYDRLDKEKLKEFSLEIIPVTYVSEVIDKVFPAMFKCKSGANAA